MKEPSPAVCKNYKAGNRRKKINGQAEISENIKKNVNLSFYKNRNQNKEGSKGNKVNQKVNKMKQ